MVTLDPRPSHGPPHYNPIKFAGLLVEFHYKCAQEQMLVTSSMTVQNTFFSPFGVENPTKSLKMQETQHYLVQDKVLMIIRLLILTNS